MKQDQRVRVDVIGTPIDAVNWAQTINRISTWTGKQESRVVCICNVHSVVTAHNDGSFATALGKADMATADGAPIAWMLRRQGIEGQSRINGPDLMLKYCQHAAGVGESVFFYGGTSTTLEALQQKLSDMCPGLQIAGAYSPPFRELSFEEDAAIVDVINQSGAAVVWVGLGCPKQEKWMADHRGRINAVMIGVGAAFDYHAGALKRAPLWMQSVGLEWLHRLATEPRRLWRRYLTTNSRFLCLAAMQLLRDRSTRRA